MKTFRFVLLLFLVLSISNTAWAQNQTVKGKVIDSKLKEALMGVSILEIGTSNGTVTDLDGNFTIICQDYLNFMSCIAYFLCGIFSSGSSDKWKNIFGYIFEGRY